MRGAVAPGKGHDHSTRRPREFANRSPASRRFCAVTLVLSLTIPGCAGTARDPDIAPMVATMAATPPMQSPADLLAAWRDDRKLYARYRTGDSVQTARVP